jgi:hypothetical protein
VTGSSRISTRRLSKSIRSSPRSSGSPAGSSARDSAARRSTALTRLRNSRIENGFVM